MVENKSEDSEEFFAGLGFEDVRLFFGNRIDEHYVGREIVRRKAVLNHWFSKNVINKLGFMESRIRRKNEELERYEELNEEIQQLRQLIVGFSRISGDLIIRALIAEECAEDLIARREIRRLCFNISAEKLGLTEEQWRSDWTRRLSTFTAAEDDICKDA